MATKPPPDALARFAFVISSIVLVSALVFASAEGYAKGSGESSPTSGDSGGGGGGAAPSLARCREQLQREVIPLPIEQADLEGLILRAIPAFRLR